MFNYIFCEKFEAKNINIGYFNKIVANEIVAKENVKIGKFNRIYFIKKIALCSNSIINTSNQIIGTRNYFTPYNDTFYFELGEASIITSYHYFDCSCKIIIGSNVVFGGRNSEIWTHGFDYKRTMILSNVNIGNNIYIGSGSKILQGTTICNNVSIGAGTVVSKSINESGFYVSSHLIRKSDSADYSKKPEIVNHEGSRFYRK